VELQAYKGIEGKQDTAGSFCKALVQRFQSLKCDYAKNWNIMPTERVSPDDMVKLHFGKQGW